MKFELPAVLDIASVDELKARLDALLGPGEPVELEAGQVGRVDASGLQLLAAWLRQARAAERCVRWGEVSAELRAAAELMDLTEYLTLA